MNNEKSPDNDLKNIAGRPVIGIASCLLGNQVRYDGGHKHDRYLTDVLGRFVDYAPVCPESECGMPIPREAVRLVGDPDNPRLKTQKTAQDKTEMMLDWARGRLDELEKLDLSGYIFKSRSPSSGMQRIKVYDEEGRLISNNGVGIFARAFMERFPLIPVEDDGRLHDPVLRENFIQRVFAYKRLQDARAKDPKIKDLVDYHTRHKLLVLAHDPEVYREMGRLVANGKNTPADELFDEYTRLMHKAMDKHASAKKHVNVIMHAMGHFKKDLSSDEKQELLEVLDNYKRGLTPLIVPVTLVNHFVRKFGKKYLAKQTYLNPHPLELKLRNHV